jgi:hypothetical protein
LPHGATLGTLSTTTNAPFVQRCGGFCPEPTQSQTRGAEHMIRKRCRQATACRRASQVHGMSSSMRLASAIFDLPETAPSWHSSQARSAEPSARSRDADGYRGRTAGRRRSRCAPLLASAFGAPSSAEALSASGVGKSSGVHGTDITTSLALSSERNPLTSSSWVPSGASAGVPCDHAAWLGLITIRDKTNAYGRVCLNTAPIGVSSAAETSFQNATSGSIRDIQRRRPIRFAPQIWPCVALGERSRRLGCCTD